MFKRAQAGMCVIMKAVLLFTTCVKAELELMGNHAILIRLPLDPALCHGMSLSASEVTTFLMDLSGTRCMKSAAI
jgi:hypothetical protein